MPVSKVVSGVLGVNMDVERSYTLDVVEALVMAYIQDIYGAGSLVSSTPLHEKQHAEARALVRPSFRPGAFFISLEDDRMWHARPDSAQ